MVFFCALLISLGLVGYNFWEWYAVEKLNRIEAYNFGDTTHRAYYYQSQALYAFIHLFWGICIGGIVILMIISFIFKARWYKVVSLIIALLVLGVYFFHGIVS